MKKRIALTAAAATAALVPAVVGLTGNASFSHALPVRPPSSAAPTTATLGGSPSDGPDAAATRSSGVEDHVRHSHHAEAGDDHGRAARRAEVGDDHGVAARRAEVGDDHGVAARHAEVGDDHGGRTATGTSGSGHTGGHGGGAASDDHGGDDGGSGGHGSDD